MEKNNSEQAQDHSNLNPGSKINNDNIKNVVTNSTNEYLGTTSCIPPEVHEAKNALIASISRLQASGNQGATSAEVKRNEEIDSIQFIQTWFLPEVVKHPEDNANNKTNNIENQSGEEFEPEIDESPSKASSEERNIEIDENASNREEEILDEPRNEEQPTIKKEVEVDDHLYVVIDTNIWLHFFASITAILNRQYFILVGGKKYLAKIYIPMKTLQELDKMKKHKKIGWRARRALRLILKLLLNKDERISFQSKKMYRKVFDPLDDPDDLIIQACVQLKDMNKHVRLYSNDNCCKNKALMEGIDIIEFN